MLHATYTQGNQVDSQLLMIGNQIVNVTLDLSFGDILCFRFQMGHVSPSEASTLQ
jgi:hypothetical protein